mgnify:CR=1 FL=1
MSYIPLLIAHIVKTLNLSGKNLVKKQKMLREIANDELTPKKHDFYHQNEIHSKIRNDEDYDDWGYGTEPLYESKKPE